MTKQRRHGDVVLTEIDELPEGAVAVEGNVLAEGEVTGHAHRITAPKENYQLYRLPDGTFFLRAKKKIGVRHEEHRESSISKGLHRIDIKRQYSPEGGWTRVID